MSNGTIIHHRNMDFDNTKNLRKIAFNAKFQKEGKPVFEGILFAGTIGTYTGIKPGKFAISVNQKAERISQVNMFENLIMTFSGFNELSWVIRDVLINCESYSCALERFNTESISSVGYIILSGVKDNEGVIIIRNRFSVAHTEVLGQGNNTWFLVQTNNDHWQTGCRDRCAAAKDRLNQMSQVGLNPDSLYNLMMRYPTMNSATVYHTKLVAATGSIFSVVTEYVGQPDFDSDLAAYQVNIQPSQMKQMNDDYELLLE